MKKILISLGMLVFVGALVAGGTGAFFSDTETSEGNVFTAGALDLKVDSTAHFNSMVCVEGEDGYTWQPEPGAFPNDEVPAQHYPQPGTACTGSWTESDLTDAVEWRFFNLTDVKPGDEGENTISLHVYNNDAWGCFLVDNVEDNDNDCTEPETETGDADPECSAVAPNTDLGANGLGELGSAITFDAWLDQGSIPGFQCNNPEDEDTAGASCEADPTEGDNIYQPEDEGPLFWEDETVDEASEGPFDIKDVLGAAYSIYGCTDATGDTNYDDCHGLAEDGRMVGSVTYYFGLAWNIPAEVGNEAQTDSLVSDLTFEAVQHRNNPDFTCTPREVEETATLKVDKIVQFSSVTIEGVEVADFTLHINNGDGIDMDVTDEVPVSDLPPGTYTVSEIYSGVPAGILYDAQFSGSCVDDGDTGSITLGAGDNLTCTLVNVVSVDPEFNPI